MATPLALTREQLGIAPSSRPQTRIELYGNDPVQNTVSRLMEIAVSHYKSRLEPDQSKATNYYWGRPFGTEVEGRSQVVSTDIRDTTLQQIPGLLRVFMGSDRVVEFRPDGAEDSKLAEIQTEYVNYVFLEDNDGYVILDSAFKDALIRRLGIVKWWWDEGTPTTVLVPKDEARKFTIQDMVLIASDPEVSRIKPMRNGALAIYKRSGRVKVAAVPCEEFVFSPDAKSIDDANLVAHVRLVPASMLISMGYSKKIVNEQAQLTESRYGILSAYSEDGPLAGARQFDEGSNTYAASQEEEEFVDKSQRLVLFSEAYVKIDLNGDGMAETRKFDCVGPQYKILNGKGKEVEMAPFALFTPILEPHTIVGQSNYDLLKDLQKINSQIERAMLNSLAKAVDPPVEVVPSEVDIQQLLSPELSGLIYVRKPGMMREVITKFIGAEALSALEYYRERKEERTGTTRASAGLDSDALQSSALEAIQHTITRSQDINWMVAKNFAETGMKRLFLGILKVLIEKQNFTRKFRTDNTQGYVYADPRGWNAERSVTVDVALGSGNTNEQMLKVLEIIKFQVTMMQQGAPLVSFVELRNALRRWTDLMGFKDTSEFFKRWTEEEDKAMRQQMQQQKQQQGQADPNMMLVQVEAQRVQLQNQIDMLKLQLERQKADELHRREIEKIVRNFELKIREMELRHNKDVDEAQLKAGVQQEKNRLDAKTKKEVAQLTAKAASTNQGGNNE